MLSPNGKKLAKERLDKIIRNNYSNQDSVSFNTLINAYINDVNKTIAQNAGSEEFHLDRTNANINKLIIQCFPNQYEIDSNRNYRLLLK